MRLRLCAADRNVSKSANQPFKKINKINKSEDKVTQIPRKAVAVALDTFTLHYIIHTVLYNFTETSNKCLFVDKFLPTKG